MTDRRNKAYGIFPSLPFKKHKADEKPATAVKKTPSSQITSEAAIQEETQRILPVIDKSPKMWFNLMMSNWYLPLFVVFFHVFILEIVGFGVVIRWIGEAYDESGGGFWGYFNAIFVSLFTLLPPSGCFILIYKGFYQSWDDYKNGTSR